jgi:hypothetical protein
MLNVNFFAGFFCSFGQKAQSAELIAKASTF